MENFRKWTLGALICLSVALTGATIMFTVVICELQADVVDLRAEIERIVSTSDVELHSIKLHAADSEQLISAVRRQVAAWKTVDDQTLHDRVHDLAFKVDRLLEEAGLDLDDEALASEIDYWETMADEYSVDYESPYDCAVAGSCDSPSSNWESPLEQERVREEDMQRGW
jgi:outer membrane murein-binding lipoprotein Lpp